MMYVNVLYVFIFLCDAAVHSARILGIMQIPCYSHQTLLRPLWKELLQRGHHVTLLTTEPMNDSLFTNLTEINISKNTGKDLNFFELIDEPIWKLHYVFSQLSDKWVDGQLSNPNVEELINNPKEHFDLLIIEGFHSAHYAFAIRFNCPIISVITLEASALVHYEIGNPTHYALYSDYNLGFPKQLTFSQRLQGLFYHVYFLVLHNYHTIPLQEMLVKKHFGNNYPPIPDIFKNFSVFFLNTNRILHPARPLLPNVVEIWGKLLITENKALSKELQNMLDRSVQGVIYFSLGSIVKSKQMSKENLQSIIDAFKELPYTVLWKFEDEDFPNKPDNVIISKWFPQQDVLRHPNVKLFITQGGVHSFEEALDANVPLLGIPVMGDQHTNVQQIAHKGLGVMLEYKSITKETLKSAIMEVIHNPKYKDTIKLYAELATDQFQTGLERAVWWTEYVLRHKGVPHLRNPAYDFPFYQYYSLDLIGFCLRHPNIILFITQGGLQSFEQALEAQVPLLGIPILGDQKSNVQRIANKGLGIMLGYKSITKYTFKSAILEVVTNPKYRQTVKMYAEPLTGLQRAI
ncbi:hypothetical protein FQR65_LT06969 [Abscondita terminalis]|nr:hypothetical protein FQR65_LT06969 [Abscondita terminalis]